MGRGTVSQEQEWLKGAECAKDINESKIDYFWSTKREEQAEAKRICGPCPIRRDCAKFALEDRQVSGVWGGLDEVELRRTLSVNAEGMEIRRDRFPRCPGCRATCEKLITEVVPRPGGGRWATMRVVICVECDFTWASRTSANAVDAYHLKQRQQGK